MAFFATTAIQSFNDYEDRDTDATNASFRPIPAGKFTPHFVLVNGVFCGALTCALSYVISPSSALVAFLWFLLTRWYSFLKKISLIHHLLMPAALALCPLYGAFVVSVPANTTNGGDESYHVFGLPRMVYIAALSIFCIDINMNIVGVFKDLFDGSAKERVLPVVIGSKPAVLVSFVVGGVGILLQAIPVFTGECTWHPIIPLAVGFLLHVVSRVRLYLEPTATVGYWALKMGRVVECLCFPALMFGVRPPVQAAATGILLVGVAAILQSLIKEADIPEEASNSDVVISNNANTEDLGEPSELAHEPLLPSVTVSIPQEPELKTNYICIVAVLLAFTFGSTKNDKWISLYIPIICCFVGLFSIMFSYTDKTIAGMMKNSQWYTKRYIVIIAFLVLTDEVVHYWFAQSWEIYLIPVSNWAALVASASVLNPIAASFMLIFRSNALADKRLEISVPLLGACLLLQLAQTWLSVLGTESAKEAIVLLLVRRGVIIVITHVISSFSYGKHAKTMLLECRTLDYVGHSAVTKDDHVTVDDKTLAVTGCALLKLPLLAGENMTSGVPSLKRVADKVLFTEQMIAFSSPSILCSSVAAAGHLAFLNRMFKTTESEQNLDLSNASLCRKKMYYFLTGKFEMFATCTASESMHLNV